VSVILERALRINLTLYRLTLYYHDGLKFYVYGTDILDGYARDIQTIDFNWIACSLS